jgi:hypothetical protein
MTMPAKSWDELTEEERRAETAKYSPTKLLYQRMWGAIFRELITEDDDRCQEQVFEPWDQRLVLAAITDLTVVLIVHSMGNEDDYHYGGPGDWMRLVDVVANGLRKWAAEMLADDPN